MAASLRLGLPGPAQLKRMWWFYPGNVVIWLGLFGIYSFWTIVFFHTDQFHQYLSPFFSPRVATGRTPVSPALFIFYVPLGFRATCYYYRKAYYRSFFADPPACAKGEPQQLGQLVPTGRGPAYRGERRLPFVLNNLHRFFMYFAVGFLVVLWIDVLRAFSFHGYYGFGVGTAIMLVNIVLLTAYTFGCHSLRHLVGGGIDCFSCVFMGGPRRQLWRGTSWLNVRHSTFAWLSLFSLIATDVYIRLLQYGVFPDPHFGF
ncbi:MAG: succinate dehydrogenase [Candidatus Dormibacteria bacterium]